MRDIQKIKDKESKDNPPQQKVWVPYIIAGLIILAGISFLGKDMVGHFFSKKVDIPQDMVAPGKDTSNEDMENSKSHQEETEITRKEGTDSLTFYKTLSSKTDKIVPLEKGKMEESSSKESPPMPEEPYQEKRLQEKIKTEATKKIFYTVQVAALSSQTRAIKFAYKLKKLGYKPFISRIVTGDKVLYKIRIGKYPSLVDAKEMAKRLKKDGYETYLVKARQ